MGERIRAAKGTACSLVLGGLLAFGAAAAQVSQPAPATRSTQGTCTFTDETGKVVTLPDCGLPAPGAAGAPVAPSPAAPNDARNFPYPGEDNTSQGNTSQGATSESDSGAGSGGKPSGSPPASGGSTVPQPSAADTVPVAPSTNGPASQRFPFPGEDNTPPAARSQPATAPGGLQDAGSSGNSSSSSQGAGGASDSSSSSSDGAAPLAGDDDPAAKAAADRHRGKLAAPGSPQSDTDREQEDVRVAGFYQNDANYKGAYARAKDAVGLADDDAAAHLALAEAARKLGKLDEAEANYKRCLVLDPVPRVKKAAEKALKELQGGG